MRFHICWMVLIVYTEGFPISEHAPHLVLVPPSVVLQVNQSEVEVNCSAWSPLQPPALQWILISILRSVLNKITDAHNIVEGEINKYRTTSFRAPTWIRTSA